jgi:hypothetical protein
MTDQDRYEGPERRSAVEQKVWTPQFLWQMFTWLFAQIIVAASLYLGISNRLTAIEVKMEERKFTSDRELNSESSARQLLESRIIVLEKDVERLKATNDVKGK